MGRSRLRWVRGSLVGGALTGLGWLASLGVASAEGAFSERLSYRVVAGSIVDAFTGESREVSGEIELEPGVYQEYVDRVTGDRVRVQEFDVDFELEVGNDVLLPNAEVRYEGLEPLFPLFRSTAVIATPSGSVRFQLFAEDGEPRLSEPDPYCAGSASGGGLRGDLPCDRLIEPNLELNAQAQGLSLSDPVIPPRLELSGYFSKREQLYWVVHPPCPPEFELLCDGLNPSYPPAELGYGVLEMTLAAVSRVTIDVRSHGSYKRGGRRGFLWVALRGSEHFDVESVHLESLQLGPGAAPAVARRGKVLSFVRDADRDGWLDLFVVFRTREVLAGTRPDVVCLTGDLMDGGVLEGCDLLRTGRRR
jgi:hypothetical protein